MTGLAVIRPGPFSLLQDAGRLGWQHLGVSPAGPLDIQAAAWANRLLDNPRGTPLVEIALGGMELESALDTWVALCGAELDIRLDGAPRPNWSRFALRAGQRLSLGFARSGQRAYLAVAGGFRAAPVLGSVATQEREGLGGLHGDGRPLCAGDFLPCVPAVLPGAASVPWRFVPDYRAEPCLRVMLGGDAGDFSVADRQRFFARPWRLSPQSDRMGTRLSGEPLRAPVRQWSLGVTAGAIQVPPDGQPIVLMADRQTMGGYPILGWVHPLDLGLLAQCPAHREVRFERVKLGGMQEDMREFYRFFGH
ncbi:biotin-dependent carboxyltransferase family protein [Azotobacter vinelandii]|uniref:5-oxoprolinase subunit C family protein n=1 Tax=Azotobacter vinelandii TaxID=354 RepID=UPI0026652E80|nr:biotin-dependent carboxyltransferase family protein [Azotobacter vinelandii]WKN23260.1 biotin-dependent carboxyltransferase family protein [Azotobacter vinelandii]